MEIDQTKLAEFRARHIAALKKFHMDCREFSNEMRDINEETMDDFNINNDSEAFAVLFETPEKCQEMRNHWGNMLAIGTDITDLGLSMADIVKVVDPSYEW